MSWWLGGSSRHQARRPLSYERWSSDQTDDADPAVLVEHTGHVCVLTINRPDARNAINTAVTDALGLAMRAADDDPEVRVIVLTGSGHQSFCAGADLKALSRGENIGPSDPGRRSGALPASSSHPVCTPVIAAVNGTALGGGTELVLSADLAVAAESASFGLPEVKRGLFAAAAARSGSSTRCPRRWRWNCCSPVAPSPQPRPRSTA